MDHFLGSLSIPDVTYHKPATVPEAVFLRGEFPENSLPIAGCTDVIPMLRRGKLKLAPETHLIDMKGIDRLTDITVSGGMVTIGAAASYATILESELIAKTCPLLALVVEDIGSAQVRSTGTIGGNLCTASPGADAAVGLLALDAQVVIAGLQNERTVALADFFPGFGRTVLGPDEIVVEVRFSEMTTEHRYGWIKLGRRNAFTMSVLSVASKFGAPDDQFQDFTLAMGVAGPTPMRLTSVETFLNGKKTEQQIITEASEIAAQSVQPRSSFRASAEYRTDMARVLTQRVVTTALEM